MMIFGGGILYRQFNALKMILKAGINDADQATRKSSRYLFWVMANRPQWKSHMEVLEFVLLYLSQLIQLNHTRLICLTVGMAK